MNRKVSLVLFSLFLSIATNNAQAGFWDYFSQNGSENSWFQRTTEYATSSKLVCGLAALFGLGVAAKWGLDRFIDLSFRDGRCQDRSDARVYSLASLYPDIYGFDKDENTRNWSFSPKSIVRYRINSASKIKDYEETKNIKCAKYFFVTISRNDVKHFVQNVLPGFFDLDKNSSADQITPLRSLLNQFRGIEFPKLDLKKKVTGQVKLTGVTNLEEKGIKELLEEAFKRVKKPDESGYEAVSFKVAFGTKESDSN